MKKEKTQVSLTLPSSVERVLSLLEQNRYQTYLVNDTISDLMLGRKPIAYDLVCDATLSQITEVLQEQGMEIKEDSDTLLVSFLDEELRITSFQGDINSYLEQSDFTLHAVAYSSKEGILDPLQGVEDIRNRILRCSDLPKQDFQDDPARILEGILLAGRYHLEIEEKTSSAMHRYGVLLKQISPERLRDGLLSIIVLKDSDRWIREYLDIFEVFLPELRKMEGFDQHSPYHEFDVLEHSLHALKALKDRTPVLCMAVLFHDVGKPDTFFSMNGYGHFYGHAEKGEKIVHDMLSRLHFDEDFILEVSSLVKWHMAEIKEKKTVKKMMIRLSPKVFYELIELREADIKGCRSRYPSKIPYIETLKKTYQEILVEKEPFSIKDLRINGYDLGSLGVPKGPEMGRILKSLFSKVEAGTLPNEKEVLLEEARKEMNKK